jgi:hypothetical protein
MSSLKVRNATDTGWIDLTGGGLRVRDATNTGWITLTDANVKVRTADNAGWISFAAPPPPAVTSLSLVTNDLDFYYLPTVTSSDPSGYNRIICTVDASAFFSNGGNHIIFAFDCAGGQGSNNPHCGPIIRRGENLFATARAVVVFGDGSVWAERWNGTSSPDWGSMPNTLGTGWSPASTPVFTIRIRGGYRSGSWANWINAEIYSGYGVNDANKVYSGGITGTTWGQDFTGTHRALIGGIGLGFVAPSDTGCTEQIAPRTAPNAVLPFSNFILTVS